MIEGTVCASPAKLLSKKKLLVALYSRR